MNTEPVIIERVLNAPAGTVWEAITDKKLMKQWYFDLPGFEAVEGCEFSFEGGDENKSYLHLCRVTEVVTGQKISYSWRYDNYEGNSLVTFELFAEGDVTRIKLTHAGLETFPKSEKDLQWENFVGGWNHIIGKSLPEFLEKKG